MSLQLSVSVLWSVQSLFCWCRGWWSLRCSCPRGICLLGRSCSPGSWSGMKQRCQPHGWTDYGWQMQLPNPSIGDLAGQAAWTSGLLPTSSVTHRVQGRAGQRELRASCGPRLWEADHLAHEVAENGFLLQVLGLRLCDVVLYGLLQV